MFYDMYVRVNVRVCKFYDMHGMFDRNTLSLRGSIHIFFHQHVHSSVKNKLETFMVAMLS